MYFDCEVCRALTVPSSKREEKYQNVAPALVLVFTDTGQDVKLCEACADQWDRTQLRRAVSRPWPVNARSHKLN